MRSVSAHHPDEAKGLWECPRKKVPVPGEEEREGGRKGEEREKDRPNILDCAGTSILVNNDQVHCPAE